MTLRTRRCVFYSFIFIFIAAGIGVVFYSQGWRLVWQDNKIIFQKTGAIFIETNPKDVGIKINNKSYPDKSGILQGGTLISDLLPKNYKIEIKKDGYLAWTKNVSVKSGMVAETGKVILIPEKISPQAVLIPKTAGAFWEKENKIIFSSSSALYYSGQNGPVKLKGAAFTAWSEDGNKFVTEDAKNQIYYFYDSNNPLKPANLNLIFNNLKTTAISEISFHPADSNKLIIKGKNGLLYILDINRLSSETISQQPIVSFAVKNPNILYVSGNEIRSFGLLLKNDDLRFKLPKELTGKKISGISSNGDSVAVLFQDGKLYIFSQQNPEGEKISGYAEKMAVSPDNKKLAFWTAEGEFNIYFFTDYQEEIVKKAGDITILSAYAGIKNVFWYKDSRYLFAGTSGDTINFIEIDDRQPVNKYVLSENSSSAYYEQNSNRLYFVKENKIYFVEI